MPLRTRNPAAAPATVETIIHLCSSFIERRLSLWVCTLRANVMPLRRSALRAGWSSACARPCHADVPLAVVAREPCCFLEGDAGLVHAAKAEKQVAADGGKQVIIP